MKASFVSALDRSTAATNLVQEQLCQRFLLLCQKMLCYAAVAQAAAKAAVAEAVAEGVAAELRAAEAAAEAGY